MTVEDRSPTGIGKDGIGKESPRPIGEHSGVHSEVGRLRKVLVHRPGAELNRITPENREGLLFDEVPQLADAQREHDVLTGTLEAMGVEVLYLRPLLASVLEGAAARSEVIEATCRSGPLGADLAASLEAYLDTLPAERLADELLEGVHVPDVALRSGQPPAGDSGREEFLLEPLPNHMFTRDGSAWIGGRVHLGTMAHASRRRESVHLAAVYRHHPKFAGLDDTGIRRSRESFEGGDLLVVNDRCLLAGAGDRTSANAVKSLAAQAFEDGVEEVIAVELPPGRAYIHLDTVLTMVDHDAFTIFPPVIDHAPVWRLRPGPGEVRVSEERSLASALRRATGHPVRFIPTGGDPARQRREQWTEANNVFAVAPGTVIAYDLNAATNEALSEAGVEVVEVPGRHLSRGRGGPRCLTCPILRDRT